MLVGISKTNMHTRQKGTDSAPEYLVQLLVQVAEQSCTKAYGQLFGHFAPRLRSFGLKQLGSEVLAMELVQETMTNVWQKAHLFDADKGNASTWIYAIARNIRFDMLRRQQASKEDIYGDDIWPVLEAEGADAQQDLMEMSLVMEQVESLFTQLPDKQRRVVEALFIEGRSQQEIAQALGIPLGTVKSRTRLALQRLKELLNA